MAKLIAGIGTDRLFGWRIARRPAALLRVASGFNYTTRDIKFSARPIVLVIMQWALFCIIYVGMLIGSSVDALAQRSPADLADIPLSELLEFHVVSDAENDLSARGGEIEDLTVASRLSLWYRYKVVQFEGYRDGKDNLTNEQVLRHFPVLPTVIDQEAHVIGLNYRHSNRLDFTMSIPHIKQSTEHIRRVGSPFTLRSDDWGDLSLSANYAVFKYGADAVVFSFGITAPTGTIDAKGDTPRGKDTQLPYAMQIGSGTWDVHPGITYMTARGAWRLGSTLDGVFRLGTNDRDYSLGNQLAITLWAERPVAERIKFATHIRAESWGDIDGQDSAVNPNIAPVADPNLYGGKQAELKGSLRYQWKEDVYENCFVEVGGAIPVWQDLTGPQPKQAWKLTIGLGIGFE
ncbi:MAG: hypothetical protein HKN85_06885 [Gammaproteobacteria bacterium]|nr:hypothetical protein [Gammaproteobacteria bacterium]